MENTPPVINRIIASQTGSFIKDPLSRIPKWIAPKIPGDYSIKLRISDYRDSLADVDSIRMSVTDRPGTFTDPRDGHAYKWVKIGNQIWMTEYLAYLPWATSLPGDPSGYYVYGYANQSSIEPILTTSYKKYGVLYGHESAQRACPQLLAKYQRLNL